MEEAPVETEEIEKLERMRREPLTLDVTYHFQADQDFFYRQFAFDFLESNGKEKDDLLFFITNPQFDSGDSKNRYTVRRNTEQTIADCQSLWEAGVMDWMRTYWLNALINNFTYTLKFSLCNRETESASYREFVLVNQVAGSVYASPSRVRMDVKTDEAEHSYPDLYFFVNDQSAFGECTLHDDREFVGIELEASGSILGRSFARLSVFRGAAGYNDLSKALGTKWSWNPFQKKEEHFLKFSGPRGKGIAQMSIRAAESGDFLPSFLAPKKKAEPIRCALSYISLTWVQIVNDAIQLVVPQTTPTAT